MPISRAKKTLAVLILAGLLASCTALETYQTERDKTVKGAGIGAAAGAAVAILQGKREADDILKRAALGAAIGGGIGAYMDAQEEKLARIPGTRVEKVGDDTLLVRFQSDVLFAVDSSSLNSGSRLTLDEVSRVMLQFDKTAVIVQGHTDSTGSESYNLALSQRRADSVRNYLVGRGVAPERMHAIGYGEAYPVAENSTSEGRQLNRRVDMLLKAKAR